MNYTQLHQILKATFFNTSDFQFLRANAPQTIPDMYAWFASEIVHYKVCPLCSELVGFLIAYLFGVVSSCKTVTS